MFTCKNVLRKGTSYCAYICIVGRLIVHTCMERRVGEEFQTRLRHRRDALPKTGYLPSVLVFAECISSGTRQTSHLPSAAKKTLGKINALDKRCKKHSALFDTRQTRKKTLGKTRHLAKKYVCQV